MSLTSEVSHFSLHNYSVSICFIYSYNMIKISLLVFLISSLEIQCQSQHYVGSNQKTALQTGQPLRLKLTSALCSWLTDFQTTDFSPFTHLALPIHSQSPTNHFTDSSPSFTPHSFANYQHFKKHTLKTSNHYRQLMTTLDITGVYSVD